MMNKSILLLTLLTCFVGCRREDYRAMTVALPGLDDFEAIAGANAAAMAREQVAAEFSIYSKIGDDDQAMSGIDTSTFAWHGSTLSLAFNSLETAEMNVIRLLDEVRLATNVEATVEIAGLPARWAVGNDRERATYAAAREQIVGSIGKMVGVDSCAWNDTPPVARITVFARAIRISRVSMFIKTAPAQRPFSSRISSMAEVKSTTGIPRFRTSSRSVRMISAPE